MAVYEGIRKIKKIRKWCFREDFICSSASTLDGWVIHYLCSKLFRTKFNFKEITFYVMFNSQNYYHYCAVIERGVSASELISKIVRDSRNFSYAMVESLQTFAKQKEKC